MMATPEESAPLRVSVDGSGSASNADHRAKKFALGATATYLVQVTLVCLPPMVHFWHPSFYATLGTEEQRGWTWLGANSLWLALALFWTLLHLDNGPCVATACLLCSLLWAYLLVVLVSQAARGQLPLSAVADLVVYVVMLGVCLRTAWVGVAKKSHKTRSDGSATWRRVLRKWALLSASLLLLVSEYRVARWEGERNNAAERTYTAVQFYMHTTRSCLFQTSIRPKSFQHNIFASRIWHLMFPQGLFVASCHTKG